MRNKTNYRRLGTWITCIVYFALILLNAIYIIYNIKTKQLGNPLLMRGSILLILIPLARIVIMVTLNHIAQNRGDERPYSKGEIMWGIFSN